MLNLLSSIHHEVMRTVPNDKQRYLCDIINWDVRGICITGDRGTGKTTLLCQYLLLHYQTVEKALYISADNINVLGYGLFNIAQSYFELGGDALFIDEVHKYPNWSIEIKNILDTYQDKQIIFSASASINLKRSKGDLSRRVVYYKLSGLSFREYLSFSHIAEIKPFTLDDILSDHIAIIEQLKLDTPLKHFYHYLQHGYYPFYLQGVENYLSRLNNVIETVIMEDISVSYNVKQATLTLLKKLVWLVVSSEGLFPNIDKISKQIGVSREAIYHGFEYLEDSGLIINIQKKAKGLKMIRKPGKVIMDNPNLIHAINANLNLTNVSGNIRESFFANQLKKDHEIQLHDKGDFLVGKDTIFEIGGKNKDFSQIKNEPNSYLAIDGINAGFGQKIPLFLFGFLY